jgi:hypothetical protein
MQQASSSTNTIKLPEKHTNTTGTTEQTRRARRRKSNRRQDDETNHENRSKQIENETVTKQTTITEAKQIETETATKGGSIKLNNNFGRETDRVEQNKKNLNKKITDKTKKLRTKTRKPRRNKTKSNRISPEKSSENPKLKPIGKSSNPTPARWW